MSSEIAQLCDQDKILMRCSGCCLLISQMLKEGNGVYTVRDQSELYDKSGLVLAIPASSHLNTAQKTVVSLLDDGRAH